MLRARGRGGVCLKRSGGREACCAPGDVEACGGVEVSSSGAVESCCRCKTWRSLPQEVWRCVAGV